MNAAIKFSYAEYRTLPETGPRYQLIEGDLVMSPAPTFFHQRFVARLHLALAAFVDQHGRGEVLFAPLDVILDDENVVQPDVVFLTKAQKRLIAPEGVRGAPALCVEVLSPRTAELDTGAKRLLYARYGVEEYWIVSPDEKRVTVYRLQENASVPVCVLAADESLTTTLLPGWSLSLREFFAE